MYSIATPPPTLSTTLSMRPVPYFKPGFVPGWRFPGSGSQLEEKTIKKPYDPKNWIRFRLRGFKAISIPHILNFNFFQFS